MDRALCFQPVVYVCVCVCGFYKAAEPNSLVRMAHGPELWGLKALG